MQEFFIGVDSGTQGTKTIIIDNNGNVLGKATTSYALIQGLPQGHMEQNPETWQNAMLKTIKEAILSAKINKKKIKGLGVSGQQHGFVPLDKDGYVIRPAKLWNDTSTVQECTFLIEALGGEDEVINLIGNSILPGYTAGKILWLKNHEPNNYSKLNSVLLPHDYLNFVLTNKLSMEYGDASGTALMDVKTRKWSKKVVEAIDPDLLGKLPEISSSSEPIGYLHEELAKEMRLGQVLVAAGGGDNMLGAIGTGNTSPGKFTVSLGTSGTVYAYSEEPVIDLNGEIASFCDSTNAWLPLICTMNVTVATELVRKMFHKSYLELENSIRNTEPGARGLIFLPYLLGERVPNIPYGKGVLFGLTPNNFNAGHIARGVMEGVTMGLNYGVNRLIQHGIEPSEIRLTGGGSKNKEWRQIAADIFNSEIVTLKEEEGAAFGAALQAMWTYRLNQGEKIKIRDITDECVKIDENSRVKPISKNVDAYKKLQKTQDTLSISIRDFFRD
jgi:xylulokinase